MLLQFILLLAGLAFVVTGADFLVDGASSIARKLKVSEFIIGMTIVGIGTSMPELVVSFTGAIEGNSDVSVGNIVGSNIFNVLMILGITSMIMPVTISRNNCKRDIPLNICVTLQLIFMGMNRTIFGTGENSLSRTDGLIFLVLFAIYMYFSFRNDPHEEDASAEEKQRSTGISILLCLAGLAALILGGRMFVDSAVDLAHHFGISDKFIAITILAFGTSLPELATSVVAAAKKKGQLALGNILGSNVANILLILGGSALIHPLSFAAINFMDLGVLLISSLLIWASVVTGEKNKLDRADGLVFLVLFAIYMAWLIVRL